MNPDNSLGMSSHSEYELHRSSPAPSLTREGWGGLGRLGGVGVSTKTKPPLIKLLAIRLGHQLTIAKSLVIAPPYQGENCVAASFKTAGVERHFLLMDYPR